MTFQNPSMLPETNRTLLGSGIALFLCAIISVITVNIGGYAVSFVWVPLVVVALWPRDISPWISILIAFVVGIFVDWANGFAPGQWALSYVLVMGILRPWSRPRRLRSAGAILNALLGALIAAVTITLSGYFVYGVWPNWAALLSGACLALAILPVALLGRRLVWRWVNDPDDWDLA